MRTVYAISVAKQSGAKSALPNILAAARPDEQIHPLMRYNTPLPNHDKIRMSASKRPILIYYLWLSSALLALALLGVVGWKLWPLWFAEQTLEGVAEPDCDLHQRACTAVFPDGGRVTLDIQPRPIPIVELLQFEVRIQDLTAQQVEIDFRGIEMYMGYNRPALQAREAGRFIGSGMLPVCVQDRMTWEARVLLHTARGLYSAPFRFVTATPPLGE